MSVRPTCNTPPSVWSSWSFTRRGGVHRECTIVQAGAEGSRGVRPAVAAAQPDRRASPPTRKSISWRALAARAASLKLSASSSSAGSRVTWSKWANWTFGRHGCSDGPGRPASRPRRASLAGPPTSPASPPATGGGPWGIRLPVRAWASPSRGTGSRSSPRRLTNSPSRTRSPTASPMPSGPCAATSR